MPMKPVFSASFEGDTFEIVEVAGLYHYRQQSGDETIINGQTPSLSAAMQVLMSQIASWAVDIDNGVTECGGI